MIAGLTSCTVVKVTPSDQNVLSINNPTGAIPRLVHISCDDSSNAATNLGFILCSWITPDFGTIVTTYTGGGNGVSRLISVNQAPSDYNEYQITSSSITIKRPAAATGYKWDTNTEYTVEIYLNETD